MGLGLGAQVVAREDGLRGRCRTGGWAATAALLLPGFAGPAAGGMLPTLASAAGFAAVGLYVGADATHVGPRRRKAVVAGYAAAGFIVSSAYGNLAGLTGREPVLTVVAIVAGAYALAFTAIGLGLAHTRAVPPSTWPGIVVRCAAAGAVGGGLALVPFLAAAVGTGGAGPYFRVPLTLAAALGCLTVPSNILGSMNWLARRTQAT